MGVDERAGRAGGVTQGQPVGPLIITSFTWRPEPPPSPQGYSPPPHSPQPLSTLPLLATGRRSRPKGGKRWNRTNEYIRSMQYLEKVLRGVYAPDRFIY